MKAVNGRGNSGRGRGSRKNLILPYMSTHQLGKKQKTDDDNENESWETMSNNQQSEMYCQHYKSVEKIIDEDKDMEDLDKDQINDNSIGTKDDYTINTMSDYDGHSIGPSVGTIGDRSFESIEEKFGKAGGQYLTVQVSTKLSPEIMQMDEEDVFEEIVGASTKFIVPWMNKQMITGVVHNEYNIVIDDICGFKSWVEDFRIIGKTKRYAQMYFQVYTVVPWKKLIDEGKEIFKKQNLSILLKRTKAKGWNRKVGMLVGPKPDVAYLKEYENELADYSKISLDYFELKKKTEKEGDVDAKCIVVYAIEEVAEKFDMALRNTVSDRMDNLTYYSFINGSADQRKQALAFNRLQSVKMKYEIIKNARVRERVKCYGVDMTMRKALSEVKVNNEVIFQAVEQGYGTMNDHIFVYYHPEHRRLVAQWFQDDFMKGIELCQRRQLESSITKQTKEQKQYSEKVDQHLSKSLAVKRNALESLPLYHSTVTYASIVKGSKASNQTNDNVSIMTEESQDNRVKKDRSNKETRSKTQANLKDDNSLNDQSSVWSKESVINQIKTLTEELEYERKEREREREERIKEKEENKVVIENIMQFKQLFLSINDEDTDEEVGSQVKRIVRKMKRAEDKQQQIEKEKEKENNQTSTRKQEIDHEINILNKSGLQSSPINEKSGSSSKITSHSAKSERR